MSEFEKRHKWAVTIDRPYYPCIEYFETEEEAVSAMESMKNDDDDGKDAKYEVMICVVKIVYVQAIRTDY